LAKENWKLPLKKGFNKMTQKTHTHTHTQKENIRAICKIKKITPKIPKIELNYF
jgi:hypothetical protein